MGECKSVCRPHTGEHSLSGAWKTIVTKRNMSRKNGLPETGGTGTIIFIVVGAVAVIGAGLFLVTNKRMSKEGI